MLKLFWIWKWPQLSNCFPSISMPMSSKYEINLLQIISARIEYICYAWFSDCKSRISICLLNVCNALKETLIQLMVFEQTSHANYKLLFKKILSCLSTILFTWTDQDNVTVVSISRNIEILVYVWNICMLNSNKQTIRREPPNYSQNLLQWHYNIINKSS